MNVPIWVTELAGEFWREVEEVEAFPRDLRRSIARALPLSVVLIAHLSLQLIKDWLERNGISCPIEPRDRRLRAGLVSRQGHGFAFIDGTDSDAEQRFSLAHELAHFLRDYWQPRRQAQSRMGPAALEVLDGLRTATLEERLQALLRFAPMGLQVHLLDRDADNAPANSVIAVAEQDADRLAYELLAPAAHLGDARPSPGERALLVRVLVKDYGFPETQAAKYATILLRSTEHIDPLLRRLKFAGG